MNWNDNTWAWTSANIVLVDFNLSFLFNYTACTYAATKSEKGLELLSTLLCAVVHACICMRACVRGNVFRSHIRGLGVHSPTQVKHWVCFLTPAAPVCLADSIPEC